MVNPTRKSESIDPTAGINIKKIMVLKGIDNNFLNSSVLFFCEVFFDISKVAEFEFFEFWKSVGEIIF